MFTHPGSRIRQHASSTHRTRECWGGGRHPLPVCPSPGHATSSAVSATHIRQSSGGSQAELFCGLLRPLVYSGRGPPNPCPVLPNRIGGILLSWIRLNCAGCGTDIPRGNGNPFFLLCPQALQLSSLLAAGVLKTLKEIMF